MTERKTLYVVPVAGRTVRYPQRPAQVLPPEGATVPRTPFWLRRLKEGDVREPDIPAADAVRPTADADPAAETAPAKPATTKKKPKAAKRSDSE